MRIMKIGNTGRYIMFRVRTDKAPKIRILYPAYGKAAPASRKRQQGDAG